MRNARRVHRGINLQNERQRAGWRVRPREDPPVRTIFSEIFGVRSCRSPPPTLCWNRDHFAVFLAREETAAAPRRVNKVGTRETHHGGRRRGVRKPGGGEYPSGRKEPDTRINSNGVTHRPRSRARRSQLAVANT
ncbi:hypothetical protein AOLI_G00030530 [Acnodon oligacanthus]